MYFLILRPQQRRAKEQRNMVQGARRGDTIVTTRRPDRQNHPKRPTIRKSRSKSPQCARSRGPNRHWAKVRAKGEPVKDAPSK